MNLEKVKIFYAHSTHTSSIETMYNNICEYYTTSDKMELLDVDDKTDNLVLSKIWKSIDECDIFLCDLTSDIKISNTNKYSLVNSNVMLEMGYAISKHKDIICLLNKEANENIVPSMLKGYSYVPCYNDLNIEDVVSHLNKKCEEIIEQNDWRTFDYTFNSDFVNKIMNLISIQHVSEFIVRTNKKHKRICILIVPTMFGAYNRVINVRTKELTQNKVVSDLSFIKCISDELKHIELLVNIEWMKII